jgi:hypothetical protein
MTMVVVRILFTFISGIAAFYFTYWAAGALIFALDWSPWLSFLAALSAGVGAAWLVWTRTESIHSGFVSTVVLGAVVTGGIGFSAGFFGPMIFTPGANQGPLLGLFITGPLGFLLGAAGGAIYWFRRRGLPPGPQPEP